MRAALLTHSARPGDAIGNQTAGKVRLLTGQGWEVRVFAETNAPLHPELTAATNPHTSETLWCSLADRGYLRSADLVMAEYGTHFSLLDLLPALRRSKARIILDYHGVTPRQFWQSGDAVRLAQAERMRSLVWCADLAVVHSHFMASELHAATGFPIQRIREIPCFVDLERITASAKDVRHELRLHDALVLLFVGRLATNKRVPVLVEALSRLNDLPRAVHAVVIGDTQDIYQAQAKSCCELARARGIENRLHLLGAVDDATLRAWYATADALVLPSVHEGFSIPVVEAMAHGLPVIAARATALPETLGDAGLTFRPDDVEDLVCQLRRVLESRENGEGGKPNGERGIASSFPVPRSPFPLPALNVVIVAPRFGTDFVGGAERSLRTIAQALHHLGHHVEVFTTCTRHESHWSNELPAGTIQDAGIAVHRFPIDAHHRARHLATLDALKRSPSPEAELDYLSHSLHSQALIEHLKRRSTEFDAIVVGPYLFGLTWDVARHFSERVLLLPCFHDEPLARLAAFRDAYAHVGGILYHTEAERWFAEAELGLNHAYAAVIGTCLEPPEARQPALQHTPSVRTIVYCGRYSAEKGVDRLIAFAERYSAEHAGRFRLVLMGQGNIQPPRASWLTDLGFVTETVKRQTIGSAAALVQLSANESLSMVALEAWQAGVPVIGQRDCLVVCEQIRKSGGGMAIGDYAEFAAALDSLWSQPERWQTMGESGRRFVREHYESQDSFGARLENAIQDLCVPLVEQLRRRGLARARRFDYSNWSRLWSDLLTPLVEQPPVRRRMKLTVQAQSNRRVISPACGTTLIPVRVRNDGEWPAAATGPGRVIVTYGLRDERDRRIRGSHVTPLPALLPPNGTLVAIVPVAVPPQCGSYRVFFTAAVRRRAHRTIRPDGPPLELIVSDDAGTASAGIIEPFLASVQDALADAHGLKQLPDDYQDVTQGFLARWKRVAKQKLLHQFRRAYVDVLSRQQTEFNEKVLAALCQLADGCAALGQVVPRRAGSQPGLEQLARTALREQRRLRRDLTDLGRRLDALEQSAPVMNFDLDERSRS